MEEFDPVLLEQADRVVKTIRKALGPRGHLRLYGKGVAPWCAYRGSEMVADAWDLPGLVEEIGKLR